MSAKILLVDDDEDILEFLSYNIQKEGYKVKIAENGVVALKVLENYQPDLIILDVMMPEMDGIETCEEIRKRYKFDDIIITFLTARGEDYSQIAGFDAGADDYITKPIRPKLLMSKIKSLLRRREKNMLVNSNNVKFKIDKERYLIIKDGEKLYFPKKEFEIISLLASNPEKVFSRKEIFKKVWGEKIFVGDRTIDVHIRKIRQKLGENLIKTIKGVGYKFENSF